MPPININLTEDQKTQMEEARKSNKRMSLTWQLFTMFLPEHSSQPARALEIARDAVEVWLEYEDAHEVEYPEVDVPAIGSSGLVIGGVDMAEVMGVAAAKMYKEMKKGKDVGLAMETPGAQEGKPLVFCDYCDDCKGHEQEKTSKQ